MFFLEEIKILLLLSIENLEEDIFSAFFALQFSTSSLARVAVNPYGRRKNHKMANVFLQKKQIFFISLSLAKRLIQGKYT